MTNIELNSYCLLGWLFGFYGISTFVGYLTPNPFLYKDQFYFKQFSLAWINSSIVEKILFQAIQFSIRTSFVYTQLNVKTVLY